jgi:two-component system, chemotaxis family, sensor kinase CheA
MSDSDAAMNESDEIVKEFLVESHENLDRLDRDLITLEKTPSDRAILGSIFRTIHTIKGTSGFLAFDKLGAVAHVGENLLGKLRDGEIALNPEITTALLATVDSIRQMLASIETTGGEGQRDDSVLIATLTKLQSGQESSAKNDSRAETKAEKKGEIKAAAVAAPGAQAVRAAEMAEVRIPEAKIGEGDSTDAKRSHTKKIESESSEAKGSEAKNREVKMSGSMLEQKASTPTLPHASAAEQSKAQPGESADTQQSAPGQSAADRTIRLDVALLDQLMNLVGELVLTRNQILQFANVTEESGLLVTSQRLNLITSELQEGVMKTRMQPIGNIWSKLPRTVRDLALACGKQVRVEMEGKETELDKTLIEAIKDPLTHIVRNSVDHGIERPEVREAAGKNPEGCLYLRAFHEGGQVNIEISDDGAGLDQERICAKALQKGLITADQASHMSDREMVNLVFMPGFSTAEKVTNVSGRGVGMDVVKTHIEKIGGTVDLQSKPGEGVMVRMKIPLTLAIIPALIVSSAGERYAIPQVNLLELVGMDREQARKGIETIHGAPVYRLRGRLLPLVHLRNELRTGEGASTGAVEPGTAGVTAQAAASGSGRVNIVVLEADGRHFGLVVDEINDTEEIVVKPLSKHLKGITAYAGATIMGDGKVALILDVLGLAQRSSILTEGRQHVQAAQAQVSTDAAKGIKKLVLFTGPGGSRMAVPLNLLARLENIPGDQVERSGNQWVTQYRGQILPLIRVSHALEERRHLPPGEDVLTLPTSEMLQVLVLENDSQSFGLVVNQILDIVECAIEAQSAATRAGVLHSSVISERVTELLDVPALLRTGEAFDPAVLSAGKTEVRTNL